MRTKKVTRHYCDHCKKGMFQRDAMERHEDRCFRNPSRHCPLCEEWDFNAADMVTLVTRLVTHGLKDMEKAAGHCPACIVSAILQSRKQYPDDVEFYEYDYKSSMRELQAEKNREFKILVGPVSD